MVHGSLGFLLHSWLIQQPCWHMFKRLSRDWRGQLTAAGSGLVFITSLVRPRVLVVIVAFHGEESWLLEQTSGTGNGHLRNQPQPLGPLAFPWKSQYTQDQFGQIT